MKANELRMGNWVYLLIKNEDKGEVKGRLPLQWQAKHFQQEDFDDFFEPIPLTPEILEKAGFKKQENIFLFRGTIPIKKGGCGWVYNDSKRIHYYNYLHELQNLVFALTGEELEINNP